MASRAPSREAFPAIAASVAKRHPGGTLAIVCHGGTIMAILEAFSVPHRDFYDWQVPNGGGYRFWYDPRTKSAEQMVLLTDRRK